MEVFYLLGGEGKAFLLVVFLKIIYMLYWLRLHVDGEDVLVEAFVHSLEHGVVGGFLATHGEIFLYTRNAVATHVLRNLHGICAPRRNHFTARTNEEPLHRVCIEKFCVAIQPT